ncbi:MAG: hypothetical protein WCH01_23220 [Methylococcaceae bacterium]
MSNNRFNPLAHTNTVLAYVFGKRKDEIFQTFQTLLQPTTLLDFIPITGGGRINTLTSMKSASAILRKSNAKN